MASATPDVQQSIATAPSPGAAFADLPPDRRRVVFFQLPETVRRSVVEGLSEDDLTGFVRRLDPDEATDVLGYADEERKERVLDRLNRQRRERIEFLLGFSPESAAGLMDLDYVTVDLGVDFGAVADRVRRHEERTGRFPTVFVTEASDLLGELPAETLAVRERGERVKRDHLYEVPSVRYDRPDTDVVDVFRDNPESEVAVLDDDGSILGVIYADDILRLVENEAGETLYEFTAVSEEESVLDGPGVKVRSRYKWLIINLGTAFLAAGVVGAFESTIQALPLLAAYMPVVAGMGGNAGTQSMAVTVRGISLEQVSLSTGARAVANEAIAGAANGAITGVLVAVIATVFNQSAALGLVVGVSMVLNLVIAGFFGALIPLILDRMEYDPATSATIFITTATDVLGFFVFLGLARAVLL